jgi:vacuolar-type H+-ATPase subunit I/STV1
MTQGFFGYTIGKKKRIMRVQQDADLLWQILVREIYVLMCHYKTKEELEKAFEKIKTTKSNKPKPTDIEKCKIFADFTLPSPLNDWISLLRYNQLSYINLLESGYILNETNDIGEIFMLDFNKGSVRYYRRDIEGKIQEIDSVTIEEIMEFNDMPIKSYTEIVSEMQDKFKEYYKNYTRIEEEINKLLKLRREARYQGAVNIELKVNNLLDDMNNEKMKLNISRRVFYNRLKALDLIEE